MLEGLRAKSKDAKYQKYLDDSKKRLDKIIKTKMQTTFIGALDSFEKQFGFLWGNGSPQSRQEEEMLDLWTQVRTEILNRGNNQLRTLQNELSLYDIFWNRYQLEIPIKPRKE